MSEPVSSIEVTTFFFITVAHYSIQEFWIGKYYIGTLGKTSTSAEKVEERAYLSSGPKR
jgi:hypothetical protein